MPITFTPIYETGCWFGSTWTVDDEDVLAEMIARVAIGQSRTVEKILRETHAQTAPYPKSGYDGAKNLLTADTKKEAEHRDGWVFQVISWIATHHKNTDALVRPPQMIKADKGLDGLIIEFDDNNIARVIICEEKATENARNKIQSKVWPEFKDFETGSRDNELIATVTTLLERSVSDPDTIVANILWQEKRAYKVAVTTDIQQDHLAKGQKKGLFEDYETTVIGNEDRRQAETLYLPNIRQWFEMIAKKAVDIIEKEEKLANV